MPDSCKNKVHRHGCCRLAAGGAGIRKKRDFRATDEEWAFIKTLAAEQDPPLSVSDLIRDCLLTDFDPQPQEAT